MGDNSGGNGPVKGHPLRQLKVEFLPTLRPQIHTPPQFRKEITEITPKMDKNFLRRLWRRNFGVWCLPGGGGGASGGEGRRASTDARQAHPMRKGQRATPWGALQGRATVIRMGRDSDSMD